jgi:tellurite resistance protein
MEPTAAPGGFVAELRRVLAQLFGAGTFDERHERTFEILFRLLGALSRIDGDAAGAEREVAASIMDEMHLSPPLRERALAAYAGADAVDIRAELARYLEVFPAGSAHVINLLECLLRLAHADGRVHANERAFLEEVAECLGVPRSYLDWRAQAILPLPMM